MEQLSKAYFEGCRKDFLLLDKECTDIMSVSMLGKEQEALVDKLVLMLLKSVSEAYSSNPDLKSKEFFISKEDMTLLIAAEIPDTGAGRLVKERLEDTVERLKSFKNPSSDTSRMFAKNVLMKRGFFSKPVIS